ncbi:MAG TPA: DUF2203 domain-containing protein [Candidatus Kapabacteria bacterium]|jgi:hypothetical protein
MEFSHLFTREEAQAALAELKPKLAEMVELKAACNRKGYDVYRHEYFGGMGPNGQKAFPPEMERLAELAFELNERGIEIKDLDRGLIDFPHRRANGTIVLLCYLLGEPEILAWHTVENGFQGRKGLDTL